MGYLSWLFFCLSPFALFCSEDGNGIILCPTFIVLGFIFKWLASNSGSTPKGVIKVDPKDFWEWHYLDRIDSTLAQNNMIGDRLMSVKDQEARSWATTVCRYNNVWVPPEDTQEQIARANGVITKKIIEERNKANDRIKIGKYFLMHELEQKYEDKTFMKTGQIRRKIYPVMIIRKDILKFKLSNNYMISEWMVQKEYNMTIRETWDDLTEKERQEVTEWIEEYEKKLLEQINIYLEDGRSFYGVNIEF